MRKSENFGLNLYEGTDIFNPLTTDVSNYEKIDAQMKKNYNLIVGKATELKKGTVHALTRENADCHMIHFTATSNFTSNDTFTVDGVKVSALLVDGSTLPTNCYIIGSEVICYLKDTLLTFFLSSNISKDSEKLGGELPNYYAKQKDFEQLNTTVNESLEWKKLNITNLGCNIPNCKEIAISVWDSVDKIQIEKVIPYKHLNFSTIEGVVIVIGGWYFSDTNCGVCSIQTKPNNYLELYSNVINGFERKANSKIEVLYR